MAEAPVADHADELAPLPSRPRPSAGQGSPRRGGTECLKLSKKHATPSLPRVLALPGWHQNCMWCFGSPKARLAGAASTAASQKQMAIAICNFRSEAAPSPSYAREPAACSNPVSTSTQSEAFLSSHAARKVRRQPQVRESGKVASRNDV